MLRQIFATIYFIRVWGFLLQYSEFYCNTRDKSLWLVFCCKYRWQLLHCFLDVRYKFFLCPRIFRWCFFVLFKCCNTWFLSFFFAANKYVTKICCLIFFIATNTWFFIVIFHWNNYYFCCKSILRKKTILFETLFNTILWNVVTIL